MKDELSLRDFKDAQSRRQFLSNKLKTSLDKIGQFNFSEDQVTGRNIENLIGATQIPLGIAGPLKIRSQIDCHVGRSSAEELPPRNDNNKDCYIPLATTEGALVASVSRGCKAITQSSGAKVYVSEVGITRGPVFKTQGIGHGIKAKEWIDNHISLISQVCQQTSTHLKLKKIVCRLVGRNLFARFYFDCSDAMGMNMATIATQEAADLIEKQTGAQCISIAGNFDIDKKPAWLNFIEGRGKRVWAETILDPTVIKEVLKTTPQKIADIVYRKCLLGSIMSGSLGFNAHFANIIAAIFIATGQDPAHVVEGGLGVTTVEVLEDNKLYFSIYLPSLIVGTVGGGTHLPTQKEALQIMKVSNVLEYARAVGAAVLAGELSLLASLAEGSLAKAHKKLGRKQTIEGRG